MAVLPTAERAVFISLLGSQVCVVVLQRLDDPSDFLGIEVDLHRGVAGRASICPP
jgi:hypothetical protein